MSWVLVGDSQGVGLKVPLRNVLAARGIELANAAVHVGWSTGDALESTEVARLAATHPDVVLVVLGGNDTASSTLATKIRRLVALLAPAQVIWIGPAHVSGSSNDWLAARKAGVATLQAQLAREVGFEWLDGRPMTADLAHQPDGVHFTAASLTTWAQRIDAALTRRAGFGTGLLWGLGAAGLLAAGWYVTRSRA